MNFFQVLYLTHFSEPKDERLLYRHLKQQRPRRIAECGIQRGRRTRNLLELLVKYAGNPEEIDYVCTDPFEGRTEEDGPGLSLRKAHKLLSGKKIKHRCIPAPTESGIVQLARSTKEIDLLILATPTLDWLPGKGMHLVLALAENATVFLKSSGEDFRKLAQPEFRRIVEEAAAADSRRRKVAA